MYSLKCFYESIIPSIFNNFPKLNGSNKIKVHNVPNDTTQGWVYLFTYATNVIKLNMCIIICSKNIHLMKLVV
jgi:hypothetical protein